jgi:outer membrane autotransporter protein
VSYSSTPSFSESGDGGLALKMNSANQWNMGITPMLEFGKDVLTKDKTRVKLFVSAGATFLPNNQQKTSATFVGASDLNGTFDVVNEGPDLLGRLNLGVQAYAKDGYEVRAQYGLQAGDNYISQSLSANLTYRF